jgi:hypothetical protein
VKGSADLATYRRKYYLPRGHWLSMFKLTLSNTIDKSFRNKVRDQLTTFFERLDFMRDQVMVQDPNAKFPKVENPMAGDYLTSFRREGWGLTNPSSVAATVFTRIKERRKAKLPLLFQCANNEFFFPKATVPFISAPITNEEMSDAEEESVYLAAGMMDTADREAIRQETMDSQEQLLEDLHGAEFDQTTQQPEEERALPHSEQQVPQPPQDQQEQPPQDQLAQPLPNVQQQQQQNLQQQQQILQQQPQQDQDKALQQPLQQEQPSLIQQQQQPRPPSALDQEAIMEMESEVLDSATTEKFVVEDREEGEVSEAEEKDHEKEGEVSKVDKEDHEEGEVSEVEEGTHEKEGMKKSEEGKKSDEEEDSSEEEEDSSDEEEEEASSEEEEDNSAVEGDNGEEEKDEVSEAEEDHEGGKRSDEEEDSSEEEEDGSDEEEDISEEEEGEEQQTGRFPLQASLKVLPSSRLKAARREMDQNISGLSNIKLTDSLLSYDKVADKEDRKTCKKLLETKFPKMFSLPLFEGGKMATKNFKEVVEKFNRERLWILLRLKTKPAFVRLEIGILLLMEFFQPHSTTKTKERQKYLNLPLFRIWDLKIRSSKYTSFDNFKETTSLLPCHLWSDDQIENHLVKFLGIEDEKLWRSFAVYHHLEELVFDDDDQSIGDSDTATPDEDIKKPRWKTNKYKHLGNSDGSLVLEDFLEPEDFQAYRNGYNVYAEMDVQDQNEGGENVSTYEEFPKNNPKVPRSISFPLIDLDTSNDPEFASTSIPEDENNPLKKAGKIDEYRYQRLIDTTVAEKASQQQGKWVPKVNMSLVRTEKELWQEFGSIGAKDFEPSQRSILKAFQNLLKNSNWRPENVNLLDPTTLQELKKWEKRAHRILTRDHKMSKEDATKMLETYVDAWRKKHPELQLDATINQFYSIDGLRYIPSSKSHGRAGHFVARLVPYGDEVYLTRDWVLQNFRSEVIHTVLHKASQDVKDHFVTINKGEAKVAIETLDVISIKAVCQLHSAAHTTPQIKFFGMDAQRRVRELEDKFVEDNFTKEFIDHVTYDALKDNRRFVRIPPGAPAPRPTDPGFDFLKVPVSYQQHGTSTCLLHSLASALHYIGYYDTAKKLVEAAKDYAADTSLGPFCWDKLREVMKSDFPWLNQVKLPTNYDLVGLQSDYLTVVTLTTQAGGVNHAVTLFRDMIFDSTCNYALPLTYKSLDFCCSTEQRPSKFCGIHHGFCFQQDQKDKKDRWGKHLNSQFEATEFFI